MRLMISFLVTLFPIVLISVVIEGHTGWNNGNIDEMNGAEIYRQWSPIEIDGDSNNFTEMEGTGSASDPYILRSIWINDSSVPGILINNSDKHIIIKDCMITYGGWYGAPGISLIDSSNVTIERVHVSGCSVGILVERSESIRVMGSELVLDDHCMKLRSSENIFLENNSFMGSLIDGVILESCTDITIDNCEFRANSGRIENDASLLISGCKKVRILDSQIIMTSGNGLIIEPNSIHGRSTLVQVTGCKFSSNYIGIGLYGSSMVCINGSEIEFNRKGINVVNATGLDVSSSIFYRNHYGCLIMNSSEASILKNEFRGNFHSVELENTDRSEVGSNFFNGSFRSHIRIDHHTSGSSENRMRDNIFLIRERGSLAVSDNGTHDSWSEEGRGNIWIENPFDPDRKGIEGHVRIPGSAGSTDENAVLYFNEPETEKLTVGDLEGKVRMEILGAVITITIFLMWVMRAGRTLKFS
jgi:parallel beta-helix repeat protein